MIEHDVAYGLERAIELAPNDGCPITLTIGECESLVSRLRQAEKDASRYRWLRDEAANLEIRAPLVFMANEYGTSERVIDGQALDKHIDDAMQC